jgi:hypothetical protein
VHLIFKGNPNKNPNFKEALFYTDNAALHDILKWCTWFDSLPEYVVRPNNFSGKSEVSKGGGITCMASSERQILSYIGVDIVFGFRQS